MKGYVEAFGAFLIAQFVGALIWAVKLEMRMRGVEKVHHDLRTVPADMAVVKNDVAHIKEEFDDLKRKLDGFIDRELRRSGERRSFRENP